MNVSRREFVQYLSASAAMAMLPFNESLGGNGIKPNALYPISIFSKNLHWLGYEEMANVVKDMGFDGIDLTVRPNGHVTPERVKEDLPKAVEIIRKKGLDVYMITTAITDPDDARTEEILKAASSLGIKYYRLGWLSYDQNLSIPENLEVFKTKYKKLAALNKKYSVTADYQNHSGTSMGGSLWDLWEVLKDFNPAEVGSQFDIRHASIESAHSWTNGLKLLANYIHTLDIKDFHWKITEHKTDEESVPLGKGIVDFKKYFELLKLYNIKGPISIHYEYALGGAENGDTKITIPREQILSAMKTDLETLKRWLKEYGLQE
jgi:L-ribulose-5-phosphate 3-epimerase